MCITFHPICPGKWYWDVSLSETSRKIHLPLIVSILSQRTKFTWNSCSQHDFLAQKNDIRSIRLLTTEAIPEWMSNKVRRVIMGALQMCADPFWCNPHPLEDYDLDQKPNCSYVICGISPQYSRCNTSLKPQRSDIHQCKNKAQVKSCSTQFAGCDM